MVQQHPEAPGGRFPFLCRGVLGIKNPSKDWLFTDGKPEAYIRELAEGSFATWYEQLAAPKQSRKFVYLRRRVEEDHSPET